MYAFGDSFDLYNAVGDLATYWDATSASIAFVTGRFSGGQAIQANAGVSQFSVINKNSGQNDAVHHIVCAVQYTSALTGSGINHAFTLSDGATAQCSISFRSDGAILLASGNPTGTVLATYTGAVAAINQWYAFEFEVVINNTTGSFTVRTNGATTNSFQATALNTRGGTTNNYANRFGIGWNASGDQYIDDVLWRSDPSAVPWVGDIRAYIQRPTSDVSLQFTPLNAYYPLVPYPTPASVAIAAGMTRFTPFVPPVTGTVSTVTVNLAAALPSSNFKCAIFNGSSITQPTTLVQSATASSTGASTTMTFTFSPAVTLTAGAQYFLAVCGDTTSGNFASNTNVPYNTIAPYFNGSYASFPPPNNSTMSGQSAPVGSVVQLTPASGTINYAFTAELNVPVGREDGAVTYVYDSTAGQSDLYNMASLGVTPASTVAVTVRGYAQKSDAGSRTGAVQLKSGSTTVQTPNGQTLLNGSWGWLWGTYLTDPNTSAAWTVSAINAAQIGPVVLT